MSFVFCTAATPGGSRSSSGRRRRLPRKKPLRRRRRRAGGWKERAVALRGSLGRDAAMAGKQQETVRLARCREGEQSSNNAVGRRGRGNVGRGGGGLSEIERHRLVEATAVAREGAMRAGNSGGGDRPWGGGVGGGTHRHEQRVVL
ncbi:hypothetical protein BHE74_00035757 [Ensete ventricosum]|nr:hypothetical protein BHE74_00035757 [Ensete ventricosum]